ncbi:MAG: amidase family protein, partial [Spirochaetota bacterium]
GAIEDHNYDIRGTRVGVVRGEGKGRAAAPDDILAAWERGLDVLRSGGARLVDIEMEELPALRAVNSAILAIEAAARHSEFQRTRLADYGDFPRLGLLAGWAYGPTDLLRARQALATLRVRCLARFDDLDFITTPTMVSEAPPLGRPPKLTFTSPFNALGWPAISIPSGFGETGLPVGLQLVGLPGNDGHLLGVAAFMEENLDG